MTKGKEKQFPTTFSFQLQRTNDQSLKVNHASWSVKESFPCTELCGCVCVEIYFLKKKTKFFLTRLFALLSPPIRSITSCLAVVDTFLSLGNNTLEKTFKPAISSWVIICFGHDGSGEKFQNFQRTKSMEMCTCVNYLALRELEVDTKRPSIFFDRG